MKDDENMVTVWTAKEAVVMEAIERDGVSYVKKEYLDKKYGETAWIFNTAYEFFVKEAEKRVSKPDEAESPIWVFKDEAAVFKSSGATLLKLNVPKEEIIFFDLRDWNKILNLGYLGTEEETARFAQKLKTQGMKDSLEIFKSPFYPLLKRELVDSWNKLFDREKLCDKYVEGALWMIKKEWIVETYTL